MVLAPSAAELENDFLATPDAPRLVALYLALQEEHKDDELAGILDRVRPIQHRVTLIQADADELTLEALSRDPHAHVRRVVATHPRITEEVCFRLSEDQDPEVRLALRKNPACHPFIAAAITVEDGPSRPDELVAAEHLLEAAWQARRGKLTPGDLLGLTEEWLGIEPTDLPAMTLDQAGLLFKVLDARLGKGRMPAKPSRRGGRASTSGRANTSGRSRRNPKG